MIAPARYHPPCRGYPRGRGYESWLFGEKPRCAAYHAPNPAAMNPR
jgi:hypothetical protein